MSNGPTAENIEDVTAGMSIDQGRLQITDDDGEATLYVDDELFGRGARPLSVNQPHLELELVTEHGRVEVTLDGEQMDGLADAIYTIQQQYAEGGDD